MTHDDAVHVVAAMFQATQEERALLDVLQEQHPEHDWAAVAEAARPPEPTTETHLRCGLCGKMYNDGARYVKHRIEIHAEPSAIAQAVYDEWAGVDPDTEEDPA